MDSRCASERNGSFFDEPHPERLFPPYRRDVSPWQPFVGAGMSSPDLNNEGYFSDHPKRLPSFDALFRAQAKLSPEHFFRNLERQSGDNHCSQDDCQRAVFLFRRLQCARRMISKLMLFLLAVSLVPFVCVALPEEWRLRLFGINHEPDQFRMRSGKLHGSSHHRYCRRYTGACRHQGPEGP